MTRVRSKRDSEIDPKDLLLLLAYWENKLGLGGKSRAYWNNLPDEDGWGDKVDDFRQLSDFSEPHNNGGWMDGPIIPSVQTDDTISPESQWSFKDNNRKRFMVSKRYQKERDTPEILPSQIWDNSLYQRMPI